MLRSRFGFLSLTLNFGLRYDLDTDGNNPGFRRPLIPNGRERDTDNVQPRLVFSWVIHGDGKNVLYGGVRILIGLTGSVHAADEKKIYDDAQSPRDPSDPVHVKDEWA